MAEDIEYDHEFTMGEETEWDLPDFVVPLAENDEFVKVALIDEVKSTPSETVHAEKEILRNNSWESVEEFREDVEWN